MMACSLPRATSHRNITPVFLEVVTKEQDKTQRRSVSASDHFCVYVCVCFFCFFLQSRLTVTCWLAVFRRKINTAPNAAPWMRHDSQAALQDGRHHRYVGSVPQQTAVLQTLVLTEPIPLHGAAKFQASSLLRHTKSRLFAYTTSVSLSTSHTLRSSGVPYDAEVIFR